MPAGGIWRACYPKPRLSLPAPGERRYLYLLRRRTIQQANEVWSTDITYVRMHQGFLYLVAVLDWYSRYVNATHVWLSFIPNTG